MSRKKFMVKNCFGRFESPVLVSASMAIHLQPALSDICKNRDTFFRIAHRVGWFGEDGSPETPCLRWRGLQMEAQSLVEKIGEDFAI